MEVLHNTFFNKVCLYEIDAFSKSHALGQVRIDMKDVDITQRMTGWFDLYEEEEEVRHYFLSIIIITILGTPASFI